MKTSKYLALLAALTFALSGLAIAQQLGEDYYGQQANPPAAAESQHGSPCMLAQLHGMGDNAATSKLPACCFDRTHQKSEQKGADKRKGIAAPSNQQGDPDAAQNYVEYGGGGM